MIKLRDYQEELKIKCREAFKKYRRIILLAPCGSGKTITSTSIINDSIKKGNKVWFVVHRKELLDQAVSTLEKCDVPMENVKVYMVQSLANRLNNINEVPNFIIYDECQHCTSKTYLKIIDKFPNAYILGLTATPCRLSGKPLGDIFESMVQVISAQDLIKRGYLADYDYYAPKTNADFTKVKIKNGDYDSTEIEKVMDNNKIYGDIIKEYKRLANNKKTIVYCSSINYSKKIEKLFIDNGYPAKHFDGTTPKNKRDKIIEDFRNNKIKILTNVDLIGEGFDVPDCECCILLRPTQSLSLYIQQSTRCLRPNGNKKAIIIDFVGNVFRHGMPTENREWSLKDKVTCQNKSGERDILTRQCGNCFKVYQGTSRICPYCGYDNGKTRKELEEEKKAELEKIEKIEKQKRKKELKNKSYEELVKIGYQRGYKNPEYWAKIRVEYRERFKKK